MKIKFLYFLFLLISTQMKAQSFVSLRDSFLFYEYSDTLKASQFLQQFYTKTIQKNDKQRLAEYYLLKGWFLQDRSDFYGALDCFKESAKIAKENNLYQAEADAYGNMANIYDDITDDVKSMHYYQLSLQICERILLTAKDSVSIKRALAGKSAAYGNISSLYIGLGQPDKAIVMVKKGMKIDSLIKNYDFLAVSFNMLASIYKGNKQYDLALKNYRKAIALRMRFKKNRNIDTVEEGVYQAYQNIGNIYKDLNQTDSAWYYYNLSFRLAKNINDSYHLIFVYFSYAEMEEIAGNLNKAEEYYLQALKLAEKHNSLERIMHITNALSELYSLKRDFNKAYIYLVQARKYEDSLNDSERMRELGKAEVSFELKFKSSLDSLNYAKQLEEKEKLRKAEEETFAAESARKNTILVGVIFILFVVLFFSVYLIKLYRQKKKANEIISEQQKLTEHHLEVIEEKQKEIVDSINYAKRIQYALLAHEEVMNKYLPEHFVLFKPKDIVSGDFYWFTHYKDEKNEFSYLAVCDSTGHGVPGAFMSLLNISFINESITEKNILSPNQVFNHVRNRLVQNLGKEGQNDGFDGILLRLNHLTGEMDYAASNNSPILISEGETLVLPCDKMPVGKGELSSSFELFKIPSNKKGNLYLPTDGYSDQFGGEKGKKLKFSNMLKYLNEINSLPISEQAEILNTKFEKWKGELEQLDDVCIIGVKI